MKIAEPVQERVQALDIIRGFAVFGIFLVNWPTLSGLESLNGQTVYSGTDAVVRLLYDMLVQTKFYTMFSFLFGLGFYIFMSRAEAKGASARTLFLRRLLLLFLFGALHYVLLWGGDILHSYAMAGLLLLLFYRCKPEALLVTGSVLLTLFVLFIFAVYGTVPLSHTVNEIKNPLAAWGGQIQYRWSYFLHGNMSNNIILLPETVGLFLLGLYAGKIKLFQRTREFDRTLCIVQSVSLVLALPCWYYMLRYYFSTESYNATAIFPWVLLSGKFLFIFYTVTLLRLTGRERWLRRLQPLAWAGRMALTNYIAQTIGTLLLFSLYLKLDGPLSLAASLVYCPLFYLLQIWWSRQWLSRFQYGPLEYLWRIGTYGRTFPIRKQESLPG
ncbi:DUF418 domain-containing protein [Ectobacillus ponti]|uniref:DUF418 domain-containing protein n=1 Tax=Ectobacillus ponti TaxID=2961894 RepID=A0AA41X8T6_9BACI|nr:DUF418 domain-containing protein [Ectobacillus ponti]MCP8968809.1 DUF418 domain-containing protein [Ectobacillus ponti]